MTNFLLLFSYLLLIFFLIIRMPFYSIKGFSKRLVILSFIVKLIGGYILVFIYTYYYTDSNTSDIYKYLKDGEILNKMQNVSLPGFIRFLFHGVSDVDLINQLIPKLQFWNKTNSYGLFNDNRTIIVINSILLHFSRGSILVQSLLFSFFSFSTFVFFLKALKLFSFNNEKIVFYILLFSPSLAVWTSGMLKETLVFCSFSLLFASLIFMKHKHFSRFYLIIFLVSLIGLLFIKPFLFLFFLIALIPYLIVSFFFISKVIRFYMLALTIYGLIFCLFALLYNPVNYDVSKYPKNNREFMKNKILTESYSKNVLGTNYNLLEMLRFKQANNLHEAKVERAKSQLSVVKLDGKLNNLFKAIPQAFLNSFFRPFWSDMNSSIQIFPFIETFFFLIVISLVIFFPKCNVEMNFLLFTLFFCFISMVFYGLLVPVLGNLVRYRAPFLMLIYFSLIPNINFPLVKNKFLNLKRLLQ
jgi:hypothetical protein